MAGIAILGAGIFATDEHLPALVANKADIKAIYSRSTATASTLVAAAHKLGVTGAELYADDAPGKTLDDLLQRADIAAVVVVLPIPVQPDIIQRCFAAGKHVLSEKPVAKDVQSARQLIDDYKREYAGKGIVFSVAEQFRFLHELDTARAWVVDEQAVGDIHQVHLRIWRNQAPGGKYYETPWRQVPQYQGGFLLDGGVHQTAMLRYVTGQEVVATQGYARQVAPHLPPLDTVNAGLELSGGATGTLSMSFASTRRATELVVIGSKGSFYLTDGVAGVGGSGFALSLDLASGETRRKVIKSNGVELEIAAFLDAVRTGKAQPRSGPEEALNDLAIIESDERRPQCRHCEIANRDCRFEALEKPATTRRSDSGFQFDADHVWLETPSEVTFVHEVNNSTEDSESTTSNDPTPAQLSSGPEAEQADEIPFDVPTIVSTTSVLTPAPAPVVHVAEAFLPDPATPHDAVEFASPFSTTSGGGPYSTTPSGGSPATTIIDPMHSLVRMRLSGSIIYTPGPTQPLHDPQIASLLQHYTANLACWFDVNDPQRQFETFVPYLSLNCPILLHAVLALSACHLVRLHGNRNHHHGHGTGHGGAHESYDAAAQFHDLCIQDLIPALADASTALDNVLPISTVVLRMYEMLSYVETDHQRHLKGCSSLFRHNRKNIGFRALKRTAFWMYFRQEIMVALATRKPTTIKPSHWKVDITWGGDFDHVKTEQMTMLVAEVVDYCFGESPGDVPGDPWSGLQREVDAWKESLPESFQPLYVVDDSSEPFPRILYLCTWHIVAMQFYHLAKVLLALHNPHPVRGIQFLDFARAVEVSPAPRYYIILYNYVA
ncbi:hypothetical protein SCUCBS95973_003192 [Sporothrix curviconia]|uniref:NAD(P)-binding protein n=1 Tax=Sporothrix curviconia TaxID=1260050 RepID=A0ABP0BD47_9PEZI